MKVKANHHENGEDLYNYDEPSDGEIEDDDHHDVNDSNNNTAKSTAQPGHVIELKAAIDTDDEEFHDNEHHQHGNDAKNEEGEEGESPQTPPQKKSFSNSTSPKKEYDDSVSDIGSKKSKHHHHSSSKKEKSNRSSKSSSVSSSSHRSPKRETTTEYEKPKIHLPKKYREDGKLKSGKKSSDFVKEASLEIRKRRDSSILSSNSDAIPYDGEYFQRMASRSKDPFHDPTDKGETIVCCQVENYILIFVCRTVYGKPVEAHKGQRAGAVRSQVLN